MEFLNAEVNVEVANSHEVLSEQFELNELQLALVGGGNVIVTPG